MKAVRSDMHKIRHAVGVLFALILLAPTPRLSGQQSTPEATQADAANGTRPAAQQTDASTGFGSQAPTPAATSEGFLSVLSTVLISSAKKAVPCSGVGFQYVQRRLRSITATRTSAIPAYR